jgi:choice-of-anchor B domain-containing protein
VTDPAAPVYLGNLPPHDQPSFWRDVEVYGNYAYIVTEDFLGGMQLFDLTQLRNVANPPVTFAETDHYDGFGNAHTIAINRETGYAYAVGSNTCNSGLHIVDIHQPASPQFAGCFGGDGYTHETQCVLYHGPDAGYDGRELCFASNEDTLTIVDVTDKSNPQQISRTGYSGSGYTHQGWLTADHAYFLLDDETDEIIYGHNSRTYIWDVRDLDAPKILNTYTGTTPAIDHNLYVHNGYVYQANYRAGLRILDGSGIANGHLHEVAYFDIYPADNAPGFNGAWGNYPFFESGIVIVSGIEQGLFVLKPTLGPPIPPSHFNYLPILAGMQ